MKWIPYFLITLFFLVMACVPGFPPISQPNSQPVKQNTWPTKAEFQERIRNKPPYSGGPQVKIDPTLLHPQAPSQAVDLSPALNQPPAFGIQSVQTEAVWEQTLQANTDTQTWQISGLDLASRYTLHVSKQGSGQAQLSLNLNGTDWLSDNSSLQSAHYFPHLLLHPNNSLRASLSGEPDVSIHLSLHPGGTVPYLLNQRQGTLIRPDDTQASRLQRNDINHFNPALANSLNGLQPYQGHMNKGNDVPVGISGVSVDGGGALMFEEGTLILQMQNPESLLPELTDRYGASVKVALDLPGAPHLSTHYLAVDLDTSPLHETSALIQAYREDIPAQFNDFVFASEAGLRTFVILLDILIRYPEQIKSWELNLYSTEPALNLAPAPADDWNNPNSSSHSNNRGWWLRDTFAREAWRLSQGTGMTVAYLDRGYRDIVSGPGTTHPELVHERLVIDHERQNTALLLHFDDVEAVVNNPLACNDKIKPAVPDRPQSPRTTWCTLGDKNHAVRDHATHTMMAGFARRNNNLGTAGVAPNVRLIPYNTAGHIMSYAIALNHVLWRIHRGEKIDVVAFNHNFYGSWGWKRSPEPSFLFFEIDALVTTHQIPVVVSAHNDTFWWPNNNPNHIFIPAHMHEAISNLDPSKRVHLIVAGGAQRDATKAVPPITNNARYQPNSNGAIQSWFIPNSTPSKGSNIVTDAIWAPASDVEFLAYDGTRVLGSSGTSFACPIVTGTVALMKSRNPNLTPREILDILRSSPTRLNITHKPPVLNNEPFLDIQHAVEEAIKKTGKPIQVAQSYPGQIQKQGNQLVLRMNRYAQPQNTGNPAHERQRQLMQTVPSDVWNAFAHGQFVSVRGWVTDQPNALQMGSDTLPVDKIEVLDIEAIPAPELAEVGLAISGNSFNQTQLPDAGAGGFKVKVRGKNILANLGAPLAGLKLNFHETGSGSDLTQVTMDFAQSEEGLNNQGSEALFVLDPARDNLNRLRANKTYEISVGGSNGPSNRVPFSVLSDTGDFGTLAINNTPPGAEQLPINSYVYDKTGNRWLIPGQTLAVDPHDFVGIHFEQPIRNLEVKIGPVLVPIVDILENLAVIGIPDDLPAGVHDAVIKASGQTLTLEQVISKAEATLEPYFEVTPPPTGPPPEQYGRNLKVFNLSENTEARVTLNGETVIQVQGTSAVTSVLTGPDTPYPLHRDQRNRFCFEAINHGGGYTFGFEMTFADSRGEPDSSISPTAIYQDIQGKAGERTVVSESGQEDTRTGTVYQKCLITHAYERPVGLPRRENGVVTGDPQPFWVKVFNLTPGTSISVSSWSDPGRTLDLNHRSFPIAFNGDDAESAWHPHTYNNGLLQWQINAADHNSTYGIELYRGIYLLYSNRDGIAGQLGASKQYLDNGFFQSSFRLFFHPNIPDFEDL